MSTEETSASGPPAASPETTAPAEATPPPKASPAPEAPPPAPAAAPPSEATAPPSGATAPPSEATAPPASQAQPEAGAPPKPPTAWTWGLGRRKTAVARVRLRPGSGEFQINGRSIETYLTTHRDQQAAKAPLKTTQTEDSLDVYVNVQGGGSSGQTGAIMLGVARALKKTDPGFEAVLRDGGYLTRDSRMVERKKYGQRGARRRFQFSKR